jgi:hypothetical protein
MNEERQKNVYPASWVEEVEYAGVYRYTMADVMYPMPPFVRGAR